MEIFFSELRQEIWLVSYTLFKLIIPTLLVVKVLTELGLVEYLAIILGPVMTSIGLPPELGLVWATSLATNIYGGIMVLLQLT